VAHLTREPSAGRLIRARRSACNLVDLGLRDDPTFCETAPSGNEFLGACPMSESGPLAMLATGQIRPGRRDRVIQLLKERVDLDAEEPGTLVHTVQFEEDNPTIFWEYFIFRDREAFANHRACHGKMEGFLEELAELFATWPRVIFCEPVLAGGASVSSIGGAVISSAKDVAKS